MRIPKEGEVWVSGDGLRMHAKVVKVEPNRLGNDYVTYDALPPRTGRFACPVGFFLERMQPAEIHEQLRLF